MDEFFGAILSEDCHGFGGLKYRGRLYVLYTGPVLFDIFITMFPRGSFFYPLHN